MEDYRLEQTGQEVQRILNGAAMDANLQAEVERATDAEGTLQDNIDAEEQARQDADGLLQQGIDDEAQRAKDAEEANAGEIDGIKALIPSTASEANKLADTNYVNSSIQTATAEYRGDYNVVTDLHLAIDATHAQIETLLPTVIAEADKNDYCYVMIPTSAQTPTEIAKIERYKMTSEGWKFEYDVNNSTFTAEEWAAIKSGITSGLVAKLNALPTNADLMARLAGIEGDVDVVEGKVSTIESKIPSTASSDNKLVDENHMNTSISTATATYRGDFNLVSDLHLAIDATHAQIATLLGSTIAEADNNDYCYVEIPTNAETPTQIAKVERYKFNGTAWGYEYVLNNSGFTADQWAAINSMITSGLVAKLSALPTNADLLAMFATKQNNLTFDTTPTENSTNPVTSDGVFAADKALSDAIEAILLLIPSAASSLNKLVDTALMNSSISTATATFRGTYNLVSGLHLDIDATELQIAAALLSAISTADNNDYAFVQIPTSAQTPTQIARTDRYKFNGTAWGYEYTLNTSGFTAAQWAAINSGVTDTLVAELANIANLIPSEASQYNKLADKVYVITQIIAHIADFKGEYGTLLELQSVLNPKPGDLGIVRTKDNDGKDVYTFYQYKDSLWNEYYTLSYHPQIKPATTGTTGDYPYNGMGRVELPMNIVNGVNTLTQDMFYKGTVGFREPNTNTVFVIRYDFTLGEDITVPANSVLEFDGGSISASGNNDTITGTDTAIKSEPVKIFAADVKYAGSWNVVEAYAEWFGGSIDNADNSDYLQAAINFPSANGLRLLGIYYIKKPIAMSKINCKITGSLGRNDMCFGIKCHTDFASITVDNKEINSMFYRTVDTSVPTIFEGLTLNGRFKANTVIEPDDPHKVSAIRMDNVSVQQFYEAGVIVHSADYSSFHEVEFSYCCVGIEVGGYLVNYSNPIGSLGPNNPYGRQGNHTIVDNCSFIANEVGVIASLVTDIVLTSNLFGYNSLCSIRLYSVRAASIKSNYIEGDCNYKFRIYKDRQNLPFPISRDTSISSEFSGFTDAYIRAYIRIEANSNAYCDKLYVSNFYVRSYIGAPGDAYTNQQVSGIDGIVLVNDNSTAVSGLSVDSITIDNGMTVNDSIVANAYDIISGLMTVNQHKYAANTIKLNSSLRYRIFDEITKDSGYDSTRGCYVGILDSNNVASNNLIYGQDVLNRNTSDNNPLFPDNFVLYKINSNEEEYYYPIGGNPGSNVLKVLWDSLVYDVTYKYQVKLIPTSVNTAYIHLVAKYSDGTTKELRVRYQTLTLDTVNVLSYYFCKNDFVVEGKTCVAIYIVDYTAYASSYRTGISLYVEGFDIPITLKKPSEISKKFGQTSERPLLTASDAGFEYLDSSLSPVRPIYWTGSAWVDATGATV